MSIKNGCDFYDFLATPLAKASTATKRWGRCACCGGGG